MRLGEQLVDAGVITNDQLNVALKEKLKTGLMLGEQLVSRLSREGSSSH